VSIPALSRVQLLVVAGAMARKRPEAIIRRARLHRAIPDKGDGLGIGAPPPDVGGKWLCLKIFEGVSEVEIA
jgi:hypothetical protein